MDKTWCGLDAGWGIKGQCGFWLALRDDSVMSLNSWCRGCRTISSISSLHARMPLHTRILGVHLNIVLPVFRRRLTVIIPHQTLLEREVIPRVPFLLQPLIGVDKVTWLFWALVFMPVT